MSRQFRTRLSEVFRPDRKKGLIVLVVALILVGLWQLSPFEAVHALSRLMDPGNPAMQTQREASAQMNRIVFSLNDARNKGLSPDTAIRWAQWLNGAKGPRAGLVKESLLQNLRNADDLLLFTPANRERMRRGTAAKIVRGPYAGQAVAVDHIVLLSLAPELGYELVNLELIPETAKKSNHITPRQLMLAEKLLAAGILKKESLERLRAETQKSPHLDEKLRPYLLQ
jgi:hypothetical protein